MDRLQLERDDLLRGSKCGWIWPDLIQWFDLDFAHDAQHGDEFGGPGLDECRLERKYFLRHHQHRQLFLHLSRWTYLDPVEPDARWWSHFDGTRLERKLFLCRGSELHQYPDVNRRSDLVHGNLTDLKKLAVRRRRQRNRRRHFLPQ